MKTVRAYIALGSNLGNTRRHLEDAIADIAAFPGTRLTAHASFYRTVPQGVVQRQPSFLNTVVAIDTTLPLGELFAALRRVERRHHRTRPHKNAPRTLDLDLLLYGSRISRNRQITLPHPRLHLRPFVLIPLLEIAPELRLPGKGVLRNCLTGDAEIRRYRALVKTLP